MSAPEIRKGIIYSCFVLRDDSTWEQPCYRAPCDMSEAEFEALVLADHHRDFFGVFGVAEDPDCPDNGFREFSEQELAREVSDRIDRARAGGDAL